VLSHYAYLCLTPTLMQGQGRAQGKARVRFNRCPRLLWHLLAVLAHRCCDAGVDGSTHHCKPGAQQLVRQHITPDSDTGRTRKHEHPTRKTDGLMLASDVVAQAR